MSPKQECLTWFAGLLVAGAALDAKSAFAVELRLASLAPQDSSWGKLLMELSKQVEEETKGEVKFKLYLGGKLGDESTVQKKLGRGLDGAFMTGQGMGLILPAFRVQELPFLAETYAEADTLRKAIWPTLEAAFFKQTPCVLLGAGETGMIYLLSKNPITRLEELRAAKLWVWEGDNVAAETFRIFSVAPRPLDILTVVQQMKSGSIDTVYNSPAGAVALGWTGDMKYMTSRPFAYASGGFVVTKDAWGKVQENLRGSIQKIVAAFGDKIIQQARTENDAARTRLLASGGGLKESVITDERYQELKKIGIAAWPGLAKSLSAEEYLASARKALGK